MAIYHWHLKNISRKKGPIMKAAAYCCGQKLCDDQERIYDYTHKQEAVHSEILLPSDAPPEYSDRETLWNAVDTVEKRKDSRTAKEVEIALPVEFEREQQIELVRKYIRENFVTQGMCADFSLHDKGDGNPHVHILLTTRSVSLGGFGLKNRTWNARENVSFWRKNWADICNRKFIQLGIGQRIDHRTLAAQGINREPTIHLGRKVIAMERRGKKMERSKRYDEIVARNKEQELEKAMAKQKQRKRSRPSPAH